MIPAGLTAGVGALGAAVAALINWSSLNDKIVNNVFNSGIDKIFYCARFETV